MSNKDYIDENYIRSLIKSHKFIIESYKSRYSQAIQKIKEMEEDIILSTQLPGTDYSDNTFSASTNPSDKMIRTVETLEEFRNKHKIIHELVRLREKIDDIDLIFDIYRSLQTFMPVHYEVTNHLYYRAEQYDYCENLFERSGKTLKEMADTTIHIVYMFFQRGITDETIDRLSVDEFCELIGEELYIKIKKKESKEK